MIQLRKIFEISGPGGDKSMGA